MKKYIIFLIALFISLIISPLRGGYVSIGDITGFRLSSIVGFVILFAYTFFVFYKNDKKEKRLADLYILALILSGAFTIHLLSHIFRVEVTPPLYLESVIWFFGIFSGYLFYKTYRCFPKYKVIAIALGIVCLSASMWLSTKGYDYWLNKINGSTFTGQLAQAEFIPLRFQTATGDTIKIEDFSGKYLFLDCWYTYCGSCYEKFPKVQKLYERYKDSENIVIYSLHSRMEETMKVGNSTWGGETYRTGAEILRQEGYSLPTLSINIEDPILKEAGVQGYPKVLVFDKESKLVFRGSVDLAERYLRRVIRE